MSKGAKKVVILSGVSGSGKSTYVQEVLLGRMKSGNVTTFGGPSSFVVVSADDYFIGEDGTYNFDPSKLSEAHGACFRNFLEALESECELVVVDNTNTTATEIAPYILGAQAFGYDAEIVTVRARTLDDLKVIAARNTHGVPLQGIMAQHERLCGRSLPPWWKNSDISATV